MTSASSAFRPVVVIASANRGKAAELAALLAGMPAEVRSLADYPAITMPPEDGNTYEANALAKARTAAAATGAIALGDDSGLEVDALGGAPGLYTARFGGPGLDDRGRVAHLLSRLDDVPDAARTARFRCVIALAHPDGRTAVVDGECRGRITTAPRGEHGFGYDPVFFYPPLGRTFAEVGDEDKARVSHRGRAVAAARIALLAMI